MHETRSIGYFFFSIFCLVASPSWAESAPTLGGQQAYVYEDLAPDYNLGGEAFAINDEGSAAGVLKFTIPPSSTSRFIPFTRAAGAHGELALIGDPSGGTPQDIGAYGINELGQALGAIKFPAYSYVHSFIHNAGGSEVLDLHPALNPPPGYTRSLGLAIKGAWAGGVLQQGINVCWTKGFRYNLESGQVTQINGFAGDVIQVNGVNSLGQLVGQSYCSCSCPGGPYVSKPFVLEPDSAIPTVIPDLPLNGSVPMAINEVGAIVGRYKVDNGYLGFYKSGSGITQMRPVPGYPRATALSVNDHGTAVGYAESEGCLSGVGCAHHAFIWDSQNGTRDLNNITSLPSGVKLMDARSINNCGEIVGRAILNGKYRPFRLTPNLTLGSSIHPCG